MGIKRKQERGLHGESLLLVVVVLFWFAQYVYVPYQTPFLTAQGVSAGLIGTVVGAYGVTQMLFRLPVGVLADCAGKQKLFVTLGALFAAGASLVRILLPTGGGFLFANLLGGCASSMWISYMVLFCGYFSKEEQQKATSRVIMACNLGMCLGFVFSSCVYEKTSMAILCGAAVAAGGLGAVLSLLIREEPREAAGISPASMKEALSCCKNKRLILFALLALIQQGIQMATAMSFTTQILKDLGATGVFIGCASVFYMVAAVASAQFASTKTCNRRGARFYIPLVFFLTGLYCLLVPVAGNIYVIFLLQSFPGMSTGILLSYLTSESMAEIPREKSSTAMGFFQAVYAVGMTVFPAVVGSLKQVSGNQAGFGFLAAAAFAGAVVSLGYYRLVLDKKTTFR